MATPANSFVPLHCHSYFSVLDGLDSPESIANTAKRLGQEAVALTDHGTCAGLIKFQKACKTAGVKPILGTEAYVVEDPSVQQKGEDIRHVTLWAKDVEGYRNMIALSSLSHTNGFYGKPRMSYAQIAKHRAGLMAGSACMSGVVCRPMSSRAADGSRNVAAAREAAERMKGIFGDDFYIEVMLHRYVPEMEAHQRNQSEVMRLAASIADDVGVKPVFTYDSHYCLRSDAAFQDILLAIQTNDTTKNPDRMSFNSCDFYMKSTEEVALLCQRRPDLVTNTLEVAGKVSSGIIVPRDFKDMLPNFDVPDGVPSQIAYLRDLVCDGMVRRGVSGLKEYRDRMEMEMAVIEKCGYVCYFLVLWDLVNYASRHGIRVGPGRGSGAASLCLYCLNVTQIDPLQHGLVFERFLNPERVSPPDVDLDFDNPGEMFAYLSNKYGNAYVARIGTYGTLKARDALRRTAKALDVGGDWEALAGDKKGWAKNSPRTRAIADKIAKAVWGKQDVKIDQAVKNPKNRELAGYEVQHPRLFQVARRLEGTVITAGLHAAGVVVSSEPIVSISPLRVGKAKDTSGATTAAICTQFDMKEVEAIGLLKLDVLGLTNLSTIGMCLSSIRERTGDKEEIDLNKLPLDDHKVFERLSKGEVDGVFQYESPGMRKLLMQIGVESFEDMVAVVALFRPGPMNMLPDFVARKLGKAEVKYDHPLLETVLKETYGVMVYQEQVQKAAHVLAGYTYGAADLLRRAMGKKIAKEMAAQRTRFVEGCKAANGIDPTLANAIFNRMETFAGYGFNKAHAAAYAHIAYQTVWLKVHYPLEFMSALMTMNTGDDDKIARYSEACRRMSIQILGVDLNHSKSVYTIEAKGIRRPFGSLKGVGDKAVGPLVAGQPYSSLDDFVARVSGHAVDRRTFEIMVRAGCMDCLGMTNDDLLAGYERAKERSKKRVAQDKKYASFGSEGLFDTPV